MMNIQINTIRYFHYVVIIKKFKFYLRVNRNSKGVHFQLVLSCVEGYNINKFNPLSTNSK